MASYLGGFARGVAGSLAGRRKRGLPLAKPVAPKSGLLTPKVGGGMGGYMVGKVKSSSARGKRGKRRTG